MIKAALLACSAIAHLLLADTAFAQSIEAARTARDEGQFVEVSRLAEALNTSDGYALAAESLAIYGYYIAEEPAKETLFNRATGLAEEAIRLDAANPEAHVQSAHAMGRHAQAIGMMKAVGKGYVEKVREAAENALQLDPEMAAAHLSLAAWHRERSTKRASWPVWPAGLPGSALLLTTSAPWSSRPARRWCTLNTRSACCS